MLVFAACTDIYLFYFIPVSAVEFECPTTPASAAAASTTAIDTTVSDVDRAVTATAAAHRL